MRIEISCGKKPVVTSEELRFIFYRAVEELLHNVVKHANAENVEIVLLAADGNISVSVRDDGIGFDYSVEQSAEIVGFGLFSIHERLRHIGSFLNVERLTSGGSKITILAPEAGG